LQRIICRGEITISLRTGRFREAARAAREIKVGADRIMAAIEQGISGPEIEARVRAWVARSAMAYDGVLASRDGLTSTLTPAEVEVMGLTQARELDALFKMIHVDRNAETRRTLNRVAAGIDSSDAATDALLAMAISEIGLERH
jgi:hypothetical protein